MPYVLAELGILPVFPDAAAAFAVRKSKLIQDLSRFTEREHALSRQGSPCGEQRNDALTFLASIPGGGAGAILGAANVAECERVWAPAKNDAAVLASYGYQAWLFATYAADNAALNKVYDHIPLDNIRPIMLRRIDIRLQPADPNSSWKAKMLSMMAVGPAAAPMGEVLGGCRDPLLEGKRKIERATTTKIALQAFWDMDVAQARSIQERVRPAINQLVGMGLNPAGTIAEELVDEAEDWIKGAVDRWWTAIWNKIKIPLMVAGGAIFLYGGYRMYMTGQQRRLVEATVRATAQRK